MNNLYLWQDDDIVETFIAVKNINFDGKNLTFISDNEDVEIKGVRATVLLAPSNVKITIDNFNDYKLKPNQEKGLSVEELNRKVEELTQLLEHAVNNK